MPDEKDAAFPQMADCPLDLSDLASPGPLPVAGPARGAALLKRGLNYFHEGLADYLLVNPGATLREIGLYFGYSPSWICSVINADMFQAYLGERRKGITAGVAQSLPDKLKDAAHLATERLAEIVATTNDEKVAVDAADKILHRYGYAPNAKNGAQVPAIGQQNNVFLITRDDLASARARLVEVHDGEKVQAGATGAGGEIPALQAPVYNQDS